MHHFERKDGILHAENVPLTRIAEEVGTPVYVYSAATLRRHARVFREPFPEGTVTAFSVKALSNLAVLSLLRQEGFGADVVSGGELERALRAGMAPDQIVFSGVGKTVAELEAALHAGILQFNVESEAELRMLSDVAQRLGKTAPVALRINPDVDAETHPGISTGKKDDKFGIPWDRAFEVYDLARELPGLEASGLDLHIGSQITSLAPFERAAMRAKDLVVALRERGHDIRRLDLGGGLGVPYAEGDVPPLPSAYAEALVKITSDLDVQLILEPGRVIAGNAGMLMTSVILTKTQTTKSFVVVDAGMNDLMRPALYGARHHVHEVKEKAGERATFALVGPICESTDQFDPAVQLTAPEAGDLLLFGTAGAYGAVQASQYNSRPLVPEVLVDGDRFHVIRRRPSIDEMLGLEAVPPQFVGDRKG
ncbi:diaminopimelate decarboxylase [Parvularcula lutaonensis]|uniref:Diaminopimelate decarboxylase n=1 Tax=Parvularcula lutaonensis TaxID=491923 RepID=A0ABV7MB19_9PROT|nr:diaminopimelate decarboxylase [Parvularcula lutaonensis]GGY37548.1 diaminopimelate decarboxylase [Parvularcula lutaonensis]